MFHFTERVGMFLPEDTLSIIKHRYLFAESFSKDKEVLEVGVGQGFGIQSIGNSAKKYTGLEYSQENIDLLVNSENKYPVFHGDAHNMPFHKDEFEVITALAMIYYLDFQKFIDEVSRVLNSNGLLLFCTSNKNVPGFVPSPHTTQYYSILELKNILQENGFECKFYGSFERFNRFEYLQKIKAFIKNLLKKIIFLIPFGDSLWAILRQKSSGKIVKLPFLLDNINLEGKWRENFFKLPDDKINSKYRIVYCVAKLTNHKK